MEYWPEFLERVVWSQHSRGLTLRNGTSGGAELKDTAGLGSLKVYTDLCLNKRTLDNFLSYLPGWVAREKPEHTCTVRGR